MRRVEVGFSGGQAILMRLSEKAYEQLRARGSGRRRLVRASRPPTASWRVDLAQVVFVKLESAEHRVGFSGL